MYTKKTCAVRRQSHTTVNMKEPTEKEAGGSLSVKQRCKCCCGSGFGCRLGTAAGLSTRGHLAQNVSRCCRDFSALSSVSGFRDRGSNGLLGQQLPGDVEGNVLGDVLPDGVIGMTQFIALHS